MAWASIIGGLLGGAGSVAGGQAGNKASKRAERRSQAAYDESKVRLDPYSKIGKEGLYSLAELMGIQGYRTPEERAYTEFLQTKPGYTRPVAGMSQFEKYASMGPAGKTIDRQAEMLNEGSFDQYNNFFDKAKWLDPNRMFEKKGSFTSGGSFGPLADVIKSKKSRVRKQAALDAASQAEYQKSLAEWEANRAKMEEASQASLVNYNPMAALQKTVGYQNRYNTGLNTVMGSQQAKGMDQSGRAMKELQGWGQDFASNEYQNEINRRLGLTGLGRETDTNIANIGIGQAANLNKIDMGNAANTQQMYQNINSALQDSLSNYAYYRNRK